MDILMITHFTQMPNEKGNGRFHYIAMELIKNQNNKVEIVTSSFSHLTKTQRKKEDIKESPYEFTMIYEPGYDKNVSLKRFYSHKVMSRNLKKYLVKRKKPDVIYCSVPSLDVAKVAARYAEKNNIRFIIDIQDLWPEAFAMVFNMPIIGDIIYTPMKRNADYIYKKADNIVAVSDTYCERALKVNKKCEKSHTIFLGTELSTFDNNVIGNLVKLDDEHFYLGYCGTLGHSYDIRCVIDALEYLKIEKKIDNIRFIVMGDGPLRNVFEQYANKKDVEVNFLGRLPYEKMCAMISACDIAINPISHGAAQSIINKHADYAAAGIPVISTQENKEYRTLVDEYDMGINCENNDASSLANAIKVLINRPNLRIEMGKNARRCAEEKFDRCNTYQNLVVLIQNSCSVIE